MIRDAVVPVAGLGTRTRPLTTVVPKALLPVGERVVIEHVVAELAACGIERVILVTGARGDLVAEQLRAGDWGVELLTVEQPEPLGLGDAVLRARDLVDEPFAIALGDALLWKGRGASDVVSRLAAAREALGAVCAVAVQRVAPADIGAYGVIAAGAELGDGVVEVTQVVEKPPAGQAPSDLAVAARYVATPELFERMGEVDSDGEIGLSRAISAAAQSGERVIAVPLGPDESRADVGSVSSYTQAVLDHLLADADG